MTPYYITVILVLLFTLVAGKNRKQLISEDNYILYTGDKAYKITVVFSTLILIFVSAFRYQVGTDYMGYYFSNQIRAAKLWEDLRNFNEPGLDLIATISNLISTHPVYFFLLVAIVTVPLNIIPIAKYSDYLWLGVLLYIFTGAWHNSFNGVRQYLAAAILFSGHRYILKRELKKYVLIVMFASMFHRTAFVMLPVYFLVGRQFTWKNAFLIFAGTLVIRYSYDFLFSIMSTLKGHEQSQYEYMQTSVNELRVLSTIPPIVLAMISGWDFRNQPENAFYLGLLVVNAGFMIGTSGSAYLARAAIYTEIYTTIAIPRFLNAFNESTKRLLTFMVVVLYAVFWWYELSTRDSLNNFHWIFGH